MSFRGLDSDRALCRYPTLATPLGDVSYAAVAVGQPTWRGRRLSARSSRWRQLKADAQRRR